MTVSRGRGYVFATPAHWRACLRTQAETTEGGEGGTVLSPFAPYRSQASPAFPSDGAFAPAASSVREIFWRDRGGRLHRVQDGDDLVRTREAPSAIAQSQRLVATPTSLWAAIPASDSVQCFAVHTLQRRFVVELPDARVIDLAADVREGVIALIVRGGIAEGVRIDCTGKVGASVCFEGTDARAFAYLRRQATFAILTGDGAQVCGFPDTGGAATFRVQLAALRPCYSGTVIAGHRNGRIFVAGQDHVPASSDAHVVILDHEGLPIGEVRLNAPATGLAAMSNALLVSAADGLYRLPVADTVPDDVAEVRAMLLTPLLEAPDVEDGRRWLRADAEGDLPAGATLEIAWASTDDEAVRDRLRGIASDGSMTMAQRLKSIRAEPGIWRTPVVFHGKAGEERTSADPFAAPLFEVRDRFLWVLVMLSAGAGAQLPSLSRLSVLYPGNTLMANLPSIYQRAESEPASFLRRLVGVLETTTQTLDARIAGMGSLIHPRTAPEVWLDYVARWLGLPWDDALEAQQKRCIVVNAEAITRLRGTRAGIETLLECLLPGTPRRFRIVDTTAEFGFAYVGGGRCAGSTLPALLGGLPRTASRLGVQATLGSMRLPCGGVEPSVTSRFVGNLAIDIAASAAERAQWSPWLESLVAEVIPMAVRLRLRWLAADALRGHSFALPLTLENASSTRLGTDAVTGRSRLPDDPAFLPVSSTGSGPTLH